MPTIVINVNEKKTESLIKLLKDFDKDVEILEVTKDYYKEWDEKEIKNIGKIGFISESFIEDDEDYSKW